MHLWFTSFLDKDVPLVHIFPGQRCTFGSHLSWTKMYLWFVCVYTLYLDVPLVAKMYLWFTDFLDKDVPLVHIFPGQRCTFGSYLSWTKMYLWFTAFLDKDVALVHIFPGQLFLSSLSPGKGLHHPYTTLLRSFLIRGPCGVHVPHTVLFSSPLVDDAYILRLP